jgi:hypothetical protein
VSIKRKQGKMKKNLILIKKAFKLFLINTGFYKNILKVANNNKSVVLIRKLISQTLSQKEFFEKQTG